MHSSENRSAQLTRRVPPSMLLAHAKLKLQQTPYLNKGQAATACMRKTLPVHAVWHFPALPGCSLSCIMKGTLHASARHLGIFVVQAAVNVVTKVGSACLWYRPSMAGHDKHLSSLLGCCGRRKSTRFWAHDAVMPRAPHDSSRLSAPRTAGKVAAVVYACVC